MSRSHWRHAADRREEARALATQYQLNPVVAHVILNRGVQPEDVPDFLHPSRERLGDLWQLPDMEPAAERFAQAVRDRSKVCVYGDFDADGACAGAIMSRFLSRRGVPHHYYVPDRFDEGYGVNAEAVVRILTQHKPALLVTVDCGITAAEELRTAVAFGVDAIVTDHHEPPAKLPDVPAVNPKRQDSNYPFRDLSGAGVALKLCQATAQLLGEDPAQVETELIELAAIGTIADVMPLVGENRYYAYHGLRALARSGSPGVQAMLETARLGGSGTLVARDVSFGIGPRLNAAGRLASAQDSWRLLVTSDRAEARRLAEHLEKLNRERQELEERFMTEAVEQVQAISLHETWGLVVAGAGWHEGVIGLVAGRLCQLHHRPVLAIAIDGEEARGSGRSTPALDLHQALDECAELLTRYGGHARAAGFSLPAANVPKLQERFNDVVRQRLRAEDLERVIEIECRLKPAALTLPLARDLTALAPYGEGNPEPVFEIQGLRIGSVRPTTGNTHLQIEFTIADGNGAGRSLKGFWPRQGRMADRLEPGREATVAGRLCVDSWQGYEQPQLMVEDLRLGPAGGRR